MKYIYTKHAIQRKSNYKKRSIFSINLVVSFLNEHVDFNSLSNGIYKIYQNENVLVINKNYNQIIIITIYGFGFSDNDGLLREFIPSMYRNIICKPYSKEEIDKRNKIKGIKQNIILANTLKNEIFFKELLKLKNEQSQAE